MDISSKTKKKKSLFSLIEPKQLNLHYIQILHRQHWENHIQQFEYHQSIIVNQYQPKQQNKNKNTIANIFLFDNKRRKNISLLFFLVTTACNEIFKSRVLAGMIVISRTVPRIISTSELPVQAWQETKNKKTRERKNVNSDRENITVRLIKYKIIKTV